MDSTLTQPSTVIAAVEDDSDDRDLLRLLLRKANLPHPVEFYRQGEEIVSALSRFVQDSMKVMRPLLCFLDVKMPGMSGHEVLRWIRAQPSLDRMSVVMLSSSEHPDDIQRAVADGAQCYLAKYPQPGVLKQVVSEAERFAVGAPASECFRMPVNLLLVRGRRL